MKSHKLPFLTLLVVLLAGCSSGKLATQSGKPEIHIRSTPDATIVRIVQWAPSAGQRVVSVDTNLWIVKTAHQMNAYLNGFPLPTNTDALTTFSVVPRSDTVVIYEQRTISYTSKEKDKYGKMYTEYHQDDYTTQRAFDEMQKELESISATIR